MAVDVGRERRLPSLGGERLREAGVGYAFVLIPLAVFVLFQMYPMVYAFYVMAHRMGWDHGERGVRRPRELPRALARRGLLEDMAARSADRILEHRLLRAARRAPADGARADDGAGWPTRQSAGETFFRSAYYFPALVSSAAISAIALYPPQRRRARQPAAIEVTGQDFDQLWFGDPDTALQSLIVLDAWTTSGTMMLFYLAALQSVPTDVYEAAAIDKASTWRTFWRIAFPLLKPAHFFVAVVSVIGALKLFDQAFIISTGSGGPAGSTMTAVMYVYTVTIKEFNYGYGATVGVVLFLIIFSLTVVQRLAFGRAEIGY